MSAASYIKCYETPFTSTEITGVRDLRSDFVFENFSLVRDFLFTIVSFDERPLFDQTIRRPIILSVKTTLAGRLRAYILTVFYSNVTSVCYFAVSSFSRLTR